MGRVDQKYVWTDEKVSPERGDPFAGTDPWPPHVVDPGPPGGLRPVGVGGDSPDPAGGDTAGPGDGGPPMAGTGRWWMVVPGVAAVVLVVAVWAGIADRLDDQSQALADLSARLDGQTGESPASDERLAFDDAVPAAGAGSAEVGAPSSAYPPTPPLWPTGPVPALSPQGWVGVPDADGARQQITDALIDVFTRATPPERRFQRVVIDGTTTDLVDRLLASSCMRDSHPVVTSVVFIRADEAEVRIAFQGPRIRELGYERSAELPGTVRRFSDGRWLVEGSTLATVVDAVWTYCPS